MEKGADPEAKTKDGWTALIKASLKGHTATVELLLEKGADLEAKAKYGNTALLWASERGHTATVGLLLEKGADLEAKTDVRRVGGLGDGMIATEGVFV